MKLDKLAGLVVLYNPSFNFLEKIKTYIDEVSILFIIDNSDELNEKLINELLKIEKIKYISNNENLGIAKALNIGAEKALEKNYDYLLTMDQDSYFEGTNLSNLIDFIKEYTSDNKIAIFSPFHIISNKPIIPKSDFDIVDIVITSGNIISLPIWKSVGGFKEELFIDDVDHDYCLRIRQLGFKIIRVNKSILIHSLGELIIIFKIFNKQLDYRKHSPMREYYKFRNTFYLIKKYNSFDPNFIKILKNGMRAKLIKIIFLDKERVAKIKMIIRAYLDYKKNSFGKLNENKKIY